VEGPSANDNSSLWWQPMPSVWSVFRGK